MVTISCLCPWSCCVSEEPEDDFDVIPEKGQYYGDTNFRGQHHGHGKFSYNNGDFYEGEWKNGKKDGFGEYRFHDGRILNGYFEKDTFKDKPPPGVIPQQHKASNGNTTQPLSQYDIAPGVKVTRIKHNEASYSFAKTVGDIKSRVTKKHNEVHCSTDNTDYHQNQHHHSVREPLIRQQPPNGSQIYGTNKRMYDTPQGRADPRIAAQMALDHQRKEQKRQERIKQIKKKYNIA